MQEFVFQSLELFELTKAQTQKLTKAKKTCLFQVHLPSRKEYPPFLVQRPVFSQHAFDVRQYVCVFLWSKILTAYRSPFLQMQIIQAVFFTPGLKGLEVICPCQISSVSGHAEAQGLFT